MQKTERRFIRIYQRKHRLLISIQSFDLISWCVLRSWIVTCLSALPRLEFQQSSLAYYNQARRMPRAVSAKCLKLNALLTRIYLQWYQACRCSTLLISVRPLRHVWIIYVEAHWKGLLPKTWHCMQGPCRSIRSVMCNTVASSSPSNFDVVMVEN